MFEASGFRSYPLFNNCRECWIIYRFAAFSAYIGQRIRKADSANISVLFLLVSVSVELRSFHPQVGTHFIFGLLHHIKALLLYTSFSMDGISFSLQSDFGFRSQYPPDAASLYEWIYMLLPCLPVYQVWYPFRQTFPDQPDKVQTHPVYPF